MKKLLLYVTVFISGGAVLAIELLGTRIIGPFYGVSLFLWSALISITLVALSAGYIIGGRLADKKNSFSILAFIIFTAGVLIIILPFIRNSVISITESLELRIGMLIASFLLFFLPLTLLGMVTPYSVKLRVESLDEIGRNSGDLYAISTIGSVLAALATGFIFIPRLGVMKLTIVAGVILIITSLLVYTAGKNKVLKYFAPLILVIILLLLLNSSLTEKGDPGKGIVSVRQSRYGEIKVMDKDDYRFLLIDGAIHTAINKKTGENILQYVSVLDLLKYFRAYTGDLLLIGLGGGSVQKSFYKDNWDVEVVEIDPVVTEAAYEYFNFDSSSAVVYHADGREFLKRPGKTYDAIILDAFGSSSIPFHLITMESFFLARGRLKQGGLFAVNVESVGWNDEIVISICATLKQVFGYVVVFPIAEPPNSLGNVIIAASNLEFELVKEIERDYRDPNYRFSNEYEMAHGWDNMFIPEVKGALVITDDLNPVDIWAERINLQARKELHSLLGENSFLW